MTVPVIRKRAKKPKTHTGCITCRSRHIKCDEEKPACRRCVKSGRVCEGYTAPKRQTRRSHAFVLPKPLEEALSYSTVSILHSPSSITCELNIRERGAFEYFHREAAHHLPGNSWTLSWPQLALHMGQHEPAITHIAIALGSLHRSQRQCFASTFIAGPDDHSEYREFAFAQYSKAITYVRSYINDLGSLSSAESRVEVVLLVSLLFFCFEVWNADDVRAAMHLRTGLRILREKYRDRNSSSNSSKSSGNEQQEQQWRRRMCEVPMELLPRNEMALLLQTFVRLDGDLTIAFKGEPFLRPVVREPVPDAFFSLEEARVHLDALATAALDVGAEMTDAARAVLRATSAEYADMPDMMLECLAEATARTMDFWSSDPKLAARVQAMQRSVAKCLAALAFVRAKPEQEAAHLLVQIQLFVLWYSTIVWQQPDETHSDRFERQFEHILSLAERYVDLHQGSARATGSSSCSRSSSSSGNSSISSRSSATGPLSMLRPVPCTRPAISVGTGLIIGVCVIALHCRDSAIRRRCVQLLGEVNLQGVFDNRYLVCFIKALLELEEAPARARLGKTEYEDLRCEDIPDELRVMEINIGGRPFDGGDFFWKDNWGFLIYTGKGRDGKITVGTKEFYIDRSV